MSSRDSGCTAGNVRIIDRGKHDRGFRCAVGHDLRTTADDQGAGICRISDGGTTVEFLFHTDDCPGLDGEDSWRFDEGQVAKNVDIVRSPALAGADQGHFSSIKSTVARE